MWVLSKERTTDACDQLQQNQISSEAAVRATREKFISNHFVAQFRILFIFATTLIRKNKYFDGKIQYCADGIDKTLLQHRFYAIETAGMSLSLNETFGTQFAAKKGVALFGNAMMRTCCALDCSLMS